LGKTQVSSRTTDRSRDNDQYLPTKSYTTVTIITTVVKSMLTLKCGQLNNVGHTEYYLCPDNN